MRRITIPSQVTVKGAPVTYADFIRHLLDTDTRFNRTGAGIRVAVRIEQALKPGAPYHHVEQTDWDVLKQVVENPTDGYVELALRSPQGQIVHKQPVGRHVLPFIEAVVAAEVVQVVESTNGVGAVAGSA